MKYKRKMMYIISGNGYSEQHGKNVSRWRNYTIAYTLKSAMRKCKVIGVGCTVDVFDCWKYKRTLTYN
jgi:hypothetical protein